MSDPAETVSAASASTSIHVPAGSRVVPLGVVMNTGVTNRVPRAMTMTAVR